MIRSPVVIGSVAMAVLVALLVLESPSPGALASPHGALPALSRLSGCAQCHAQGGLDAGCLGCHSEIAGQIESGEGYHRDLKADCAHCHPEHHGEEFDLMGATLLQQEDFEHDHVVFTLEGKHTELACRKCHDAAFSLPDFPEHSRTGTFLGKTQECAQCHEDVHEGGRYTACMTCHGQESFAPAVGFDHDKHFPLLGGHSEVVCKSCHVSFDKTRGRQCRECHESPHKTDWGVSCEQCHAAHEPRWAAGGGAVTLAVHEKTGFSLAAPHAEVACEKCHKPDMPYDRRFPDPARGQESCRSCHADVHAGQFGQRTCLECHDRTRFKPARYSRKQHDTFALRQGHARAECNACHKPVAGTRRFKGTPRSCRACHEDVHKGQFQAECSACHNERRFQPAEYDLRSHDAFALKGKHRAVSCRACHKQVKGTRRFVGTERACKACHEDPHKNQFARDLKGGDCTACHWSDARSFEVKPFDHARHYPLQDAHAETTCNACHKGSPRRYRGLSQRCASCHEDVHRGQFRQGGVTRCEQCHTSTRKWSPERFDHDRTRFPLDGTHAKVACNACHLGVRQPDQSIVIQYKHLGTKCIDCHDFKKR